MRIPESFNEYIRNSGRVDFYPFLKVYANNEIVSPILNQDSGRRYWGVESSMEPQEDMNEPRKKKKKKSKITKHRCKITR